MAELAKDPEAGIASGVAPATDKHLGGISAAEPTPLPIKPMMLLMLIVFCEPLNIIVVFPFVVFMVESFGVEEDKVGLYVGILSACFAGAQTLTSILWGWLSDRLGRRPALLLGISGTSIAILVFGFAQNYAWAIAARAMAGALSGNIGVSKSAMGEITDSSNSARAFSLFGLVFGLGGIIGSLLGGFLADPVGSHPTWFEDGGALREFFVKFPYCLPCIACSLIGLVAFTVGFFFFAETAPHIIEAQRKRKESLLASETQSLLHADATATAKREVDDGAPPPTTPTPAPSNEKKLTVLGSFTDRSTLSAIVAYGLTAFTAIMHDELYVIWAVAEISHGGLAFSSGQVGTTLMIAGFWLIFAQAFLYPFLARFLGAKYIWRTMALILAPIVALFPTLSLLAKRDLTVLLWVLLLVLMAARIVAVQCLFTPSMLFVNNSATAANIGTVNGVGQMVGSASRTAGPFLAGALWSLSGNSFGFGGRVVFFFVASMGIVMFAWSFVLPDSINRKRTDNDDKRDSSTLPAASVVVAAE